MGRRVLVGIGAGLVTVALLAGVAAVAYRAGHQRDGTRVAVGDGEVVRVVDGHWGRGPGFGFLVFPLLVAGAVVLWVATRPWRGPGGYGPGAFGPGGWGRAGCGADPDAALADWHRRAHGDDPAGSPPAGGGRQGAAPGQAG